MALMRISDLSDDLLIKILSFLPTKVAVSTSILSKQWQFLWMWLPKLEYDDSDIAKSLSSWLRYDEFMSSWLRYEEFIDKKLPLHRAPVLETLLLSFVRSRLSQPEKIKRWVEIAVSRFVRELSVGYFNSNEELFLSLPSSGDSLMALKLEGKNILVDVPRRTVYLPCLKTLQLRCVTYANEASLPLLLSHCPVLEDLFIERDDDDGNAGVIVVNVPSLQSVGIVLSQLEHLKLRVYKNDWSKLLIWLLRNSPKLRVLNLYVDFYRQREEYEPVDLKSKESSVPECLLTSLETLEFSSYMGTQEERDFLSFFFKHASCLKSTSVIHRAPRRALRRLYISES